MSKHFLSVDAWLRWQEQLHPQSIDLGLERVASVWQRLHPQGLDCTIVTVGGTNGKGSCVALLGAILQAAGYRVGLYTSPHLLRYNERICINDTQVADAQLCATFERIEQAHADISLTYFEFGTLAALDVFATAALDVIILEVGLGGRLDAVNILDADIALITTVDLDHTEWLGPNRESIAKEKAGIFRTGHPAIIGEATPPPALLDHARNLGTPILQAGRDFHAHSNPPYWDWHGPKHSLWQLPMPKLKAVRQLDNAAAVLTVLDCLAKRLPVTRQAVCAGLTSVQLPGRLQIVPGPVTWILDVAHNVQAAAALAQDLASRTGTGKTHGVFACLADKDASGILKALQPQVGLWHLAQLSGPRARSVADLANILETSGIFTPKISYNSAWEALNGAVTAAREGDRILVTGSFLTVAAAIEYLALA